MILSKYYERFDVSCLSDIETCFGHWCPKLINSNKIPFHSNSLPVCANWFRSALLSCMVLVPTWGCWTAPLDQLMHVVRHQVGSSAILDKKLIPLCACNFHNLRFQNGFCCGLKLLLFCHLGIWQNLNFCLIPGSLCFYSETSECIFLKNLIKYDLFWCL